MRLGHDQHVDRVAEGGFASSQELNPGANGFAEFYEIYWPQLLRFSTRNFGDLDPEEITQETLTRACYFFSELACRADPWPWLARVARNLGYDQLRARSVCQPSQELMLSRAAVRELDGVEELALRAEHTRLLQRSLLNLQGRRRLVVELHDLGGISCIEIGARLGISPGAARMELMRARRQLREICLSLGVDEADRRGRIQA